MPDFELTAIILLGFLLDLSIGDPKYRGHPIRLIGRGIAFFLKCIMGLGMKGKGGGVLLVVMTTGVSVGVYAFIRSVTFYFYPPMTLLIDLFTCYSCLALKDLAKHIKPVIEALETGDVSGARKDVAMVVGRDVSRLDEAGVARAAVETLAENFVDGFLSPLFWYVAGGILGHVGGLSPVMTALCFMITFKAASTLDSMVGYKNDAFLNMGWAGARLDDVMNLIPARLSLIILFAGACLTGLDAKGGMCIALRDRLKHASPNAGHAESFAAGALHIRLGGPTRYPDGLKEKPWLGDGHTDAGPEHIHRALTLLYGAAWIVMAATVAVLSLCIH